MPRKKTYKEPQQQSSKNNKVATQSSAFHLDFLNPSQKLAWAAYQKHDLLFLLGPAGTGKTFLAAAFAVHDLLKNHVEKVVLTRPTVEAGNDSLGYLPGEISEKLHPYMIPIYDCVEQICGKAGPHKDKVSASLELAPLQFMRGRTFRNSVVIFDEAQNATKEQLKLAITRIGMNSKMIITGDPDQSDLSNSGLEYMVSKISSVEGVGLIRFTESSIVRHPLIARILKKLD